MSGARIVLNSRYFHIARAGEKVDGKHAMTNDAAMGLVDYVGTRESVEDFHERRKSYRLKS